jgi:acyl-CoA thioesterase FadM
MELEVSYRAEAFYGDEVLSAAQRVPGGDAGPVFLHQILDAATGTELARLRTRWE